MLQALQRHGFAAGEPGLLGRRITRRQDWCKSGQVADREPMFVPSAYRENK
jgi:hypothetical protein